MCFASFLSGVFTTMAVINPPERKLAKRTSVGCTVHYDWLKVWEAGALVLPRYLLFLLIVNSLPPIYLQLFEISSLMHWIFLPAVACKIQV